MRSIYCVLLVLFLGMPVRRAADPISVQHVWDAIRSANFQRQMADLPRIVKYLQKVDKCSQAQAQLYVQQTIQDGLILYVNNFYLFTSKPAKQSMSTVCISYKGRKTACT